MTIKEWQKNVDDWIKSYGVRYFDIKTNGLLLSEEVGEFNRIIARAYGEQSFKVDKSEDEIISKCSEELADIIFVVTCLANQLELDLSESLIKNLEKKSGRDKNRHHSNPKLS